MDASEEAAPTPVCGHASGIVTSGWSRRSIAHHKPHGITKSSAKLYSVASSGATEHVGKGSRLPPDPVITVTRVYIYIYIYVYRCPLLPAGLVSSVRPKVTSLVTAQQRGVWGLQAFGASHVFQEDAKQTSHAASKGVAQDNNLVSFAVELDEVVHHLVRPRKRTTARGYKQIGISVWADTRLIARTRLGLATYLYPYVRET